MLRGGLSFRRVRGTSLSRRPMLLAPHPLCDPSAGSRCSPRPPRAGRAATTSLKNETREQHDHRHHEAADDEPAREAPRAERQHRDGDHEHCRRTDAVDVEERVRERTREPDRVGARNAAPPGTSPRGAVPPPRQPRRTASPRRAGRSRGRRSRRTVLSVADVAPDHCDEPQERDARERCEVETDERNALGVVAEVPLGDLRGAALGGRLVADEEDGPDEQGREEESGDARRTRRPDVADQWPDERSRCSRLRCRHEATRLHGRYGRARRGATGGLFLRCLVRE